MNYRLLAIDPSIRAPGYAVLDLGRAAPRLIAAGVWNTEPAKGVTRGDDNVRRTLYVWRVLRRVIALHDPIAIAIESGAGSKNAKTALMLGHAQALAACAADDHLGGASPIYVTALQAGVVLGLTPTQRRAKGSGPKTSAQSARDRKARKAAVAAAVIERLGVAAWREALGLDDEDEHEDDLRAPRWEGAHDAAAVALAAWERPEVGGLRAIARQTRIPGTEGAVA